MAADIHEPSTSEACFGDAALTTTSVAAPAMRRIVEKLAASMAPSWSAIRQRIEFAANATSARAVYEKTETESDFPTYLRDGIPYRARISRTRSIGIASIVPPLPRTVVALNIEL